MYYKMRSIWLFKTFNSQQLPIHIFIFLLSVIPKLQAILQRNFVEEKINLTHYSWFMNVVTIFYSPVRNRSSVCGPYPTTCNWQVSAGLVTTSIV